MEDKEAPLSREIPLRGVGFDVDSNVFKFAGEDGGSPASVTLSGEQLKILEEREAKLKLEIYDLFVNAGKTSEEARQLAGLD